MLNEEQRDRYARHLNLAEIGAQGQSRLLAARVAVVGVGGLGSPAAFYLVAAGVGCVGLIDGDVVELSNLQRQILHSTPDLGRRKVDSAADMLSRLNPDSQVRTVACRLDSDTGESLLADYDFVIDATDNFAAKFTLADVCHRLGKPYSHAGIREFFGQTMTVLPGRTTCYRCVFERPPEVQGAALGPLGVLPGVVGAIQATEAIKFILELGDLLTNVLLTYDALRMDFRKIPVRRNPSCPLCSKTEELTLAKARRTQRMAKVGRGGKLDDAAMATPRQSETGFITNLGDLGGLAREKRFEQGNAPDARSSHRRFLRSATGGTVSGAG